MKNLVNLLLLPVVLFLVLISMVAMADDRVPPASWATVEAHSKAQLTSLDFGPLNMTARAAEDQYSLAVGKPPRFAYSHQLSRSLDRHGRWIEQDGVAIWRLRVSAEQAVSLNFGFDNVFLPAGSRLYFYTPGASEQGEMDRYTVLGPFTDRINKPHGQFWTPVMAADEIVIELNVPVDLRDQASLNLIHVGHGYRGFGASTADSVSLAQKGVQSDEDCAKSGAKSGSCHMDVACLADDDPWNESRHAVAAFSVGGTLACTGALVNNTANDERMLFLTATHCGVDGSSAPSMVVYWNYEWPTCRTPGRAVGSQVNSPDPSLTNLGGQFLAATPDPFAASCTNPGACSDVTLLELEDPPNPNAAVYWAGWDRDELAASCGPQGPAGSTAGLCASIHHPSVHEKRITFVEQDLEVGDIANAEGIHWHAFWHQSPPVVANIAAPKPMQLPPATTEPGSSGSPLFNASRRMVGVLSGGPSFCGATGDDLSDFYGALAHAWDGLGSSSTRIRDYLDPIGSGAMSIAGKGRGQWLNTIDPFTASQGPVTVGPGEEFDLDEAVLLTSSVLGGFRILGVVVSDEAAPGSTATIQVANGELICDLDFTSNNEQTANGGCSTGYFRPQGSTFDFSAVSRIEIDVVEVVGMANWGLFLVDANQVGAFTGLSGDHTPELSAGLLGASRADFSSLPGQSFDWSRVDTVVLNMVNRDGSDARVRLGEVTTVGAIQIIDTGSGPELTDDELSDTISGNYFNPGRSGEGCMLTREGDQTTFILTCYVYNAGKQAWVIGVGLLEDGNISFGDMVLTRGTGFGDAFDADAVERIPFGNVQMSFTDCNNAEISMVPVVPGFVPVNLPMERIVQVDCSDGVPAPQNAARAGNWFNPARSGEGFQLAAEGDEDLHILTFYTYLDGEQVWLIGTGLLDGDTIEFGDVVITGGTGFGPAFNAADVERIPFGTITMEFDDCNSATIRTESILSEFPDLETEVIRIIGGPC